MKLTLTLAIIALTATTAMASPNNSNGPRFGGSDTNIDTTVNNANTNRNTNNNTNLNHNQNTAVAGASSSSNAAAIAAQQQGQIQGQAQGQGQRQSASANNSNSVRQSQSANNRNNVSNNTTFEGSVGAIAVAAAACTNGASLGVIGASIGFSISDSDCKIINEAAALQAMGFASEAATHLRHIARINASFEAVEAARTPAPVAMPFSQAVSYVTCDLDTASNTLTVRQAEGFTFERASADCLAAQGF